VTFPITSSN